MATELYRNENRLVGGDKKRADPDKDQPYYSEGTWFVAVKCTTTIQTIKRSWGYDYSGQLEVLNGVPYTLTATWDVNNGIDDNAFPIQNISILQNYPNPFNPVTNIIYTLSLVSGKNL